MPLVVPFVSKDPSSKDASDSSTSTTSTTNPVIPSEETLKSGVFDKGDKNAQAKVEHFQAMPGPVVPSDTSVFTNKPSREEQQARANELNK
jgi:hypothetical protein